MGEDSTGPYETPSGTTSGNMSRRVTVDQAARVLGLTVDAIRKRVQRGTIPYEKDPAGRVTILLDSPDSDSTVQDEARDSTGRGPDTERLIADRDELVEELQDQVAFLRRELEARTEETRRKDHIIMALTQRVPELESPREELHGPETKGAEATEGIDTPTDRGQAETGVQRRSRSWWRRFFGFE